MGWSLHRRGDMKAPGGDGTRCAIDGWGGAGVPVIALGFGHPDARFSEARIPDARFLGARRFRLVAAIQHF